MPLPQVVAAVVAATGQYEPAGQLRHVLFADAPVWLLTVPAGQATGVVVSVGQ